MNSRVSILLCLFTLAATMTVQADDRIESGLQQALTRDGTVRATILFELEASTESAGLTRAERQASRMAAVQRAGDAVIEAGGEGFQLHRRFNLVSAVVANIDQTALDRVLALESVRSVGLDPGGEGHLDVARALMGIDTIQAAPPAGLGVTGQNVKVVVMDSGIDSDNVDFSGALVDEACFCLDGGAGCCPAGGTTQFGAGAAEDDHDHGTWVTGFVLSRGNDAPVGAAPAASLVAVKVLDSNNSFCCASDVTAAYDWVATNHADADVLNASLGTNALFNAECSSSTTWLQAMSQATAAVEANGTIMTASSGNQSSATGMAAPSCIDEVMAVGATYKQDYSVPSCPPSQEDSITCYSNVSPELAVLAPGSFMTSTRLGGGTAVNLQGTSFASPLVAGCAALIRSAFPSATDAQVRNALITTGVPILDTRVGLTFPRVDCLAAIQAFTPLIFEDRFESP
jgi:subtilisin family serine protease